MGPEDNSVMENDHQDRHTAKKIQLRVPLITSDLNVSYIVQDSSPYDNGQFCYDCYGEEGRRSFWGEACISKSYVERRWPEIFDVCDYIEDRGACPQNVIVARKRA